MKKIMTAALLLVLGAAQAMPVNVPRMNGQPASASASQDSGYSRSDADMDDDDEAAPPVHIHHAHAATKKPVAHRGVVRRGADNDSHKAVAPQGRTFPQRPKVPADASLAHSGIKK